jgi:cytochrome c553
MTNQHYRSALAIALLAATAMLAACGGEGSDRAAGHTRSSAGLPTGHVDAGEQLAQRKGKATGQACVDCHGPAGNAPIDATYPKLAGQYRDYLAHSLQMYRDGDRANALMAAQAADLTDQEIADLAAYFAAQPGDLTDLSAL